MLYHYSCFTSHLGSTKTKHQISHIDEWEWPDFSEDRRIKMREAQQPKSLANVQYHNCSCHLSDPQDLVRWKVISSEHSLVDHCNEEASCPIKSSRPHALEHGGACLHFCGTHIWLSNISGVRSNTPADPVRKTRLCYQLSHISPQISHNGISDCFCTEDYF